VTLVDTSTFQIIKLALLAGFDMPISAIVGFVQRSTAISTHPGGEVSFPLNSLPPPSSTATKQTPNTSSRWFPIYEYMRSVSSRSHSGFHE
jgi:hypothetical protein